MPPPRPEGAEPHGRETPASPEYSAIIPVFNSRSFVGETIDACLRFFDQQGVSHELVLVDDGSRDGSWDVLTARAAACPQIVAIRLLRNYGQHTAVYCGLEHSRGRWVITLDDDLQHPPEEIAHLLARRHESDAIFGRFGRKQHSLVRRLGSELINRLNHYIFGQPRGLVVSSFRLLRREVVDRILSYRVREPYINGLVVLCAEHPTNVTVQHLPSKRGQSGYDRTKLLALVARILFNYSSFPLRMVSFAGILVALASLLLSVYFAARALLVGNRVPGWASLAVLVSFFNGVSLLLLGMLGEYLVRTLDQVRGAAPYEVAQVLRTPGRPDDVTADQDLPRP